MESQRTPERALSAAAMGVVLATLAGMDAPWTLVANRDPAALPDAAFSGAYLTARLALGALAAVLVIGAAIVLWRARDADMSERAP